MNAEKLAFLQNFYTDVTLYVPAEPVPAPVPVEPAPEPAAFAAAPTPTPRPVAPVAPVSSRAPDKPIREVHLPSKGYSHPSAGLERLASGFGHPQAAGLLASTLPPASALRLPTETPAPPVPPATFTTLGSNAQGVVLLFRLPAEQFERLHRNVFLNKMLQALGLVMADVVLVNVESERPVALVNLRRELATTHVVAFGKNLLDTTIRNTQIYEPVLFPNLSLSYLASATVDLVEYDTSLKKRLWPGLQRMFLN